MKRLLLPALVLLTVACSPLTEPLPTHPSQLQFEPLDFKVPTVTKRVLDNGMHLYLKEDTELPLINMTAVIEGGSISDPQDRAGLASLYATLLRTGGTASLTPDELDTRLEFHAIDLGVSAETYTVTLDMSLRSADLDVGLEILAEILRRPRFAAERLELARRQEIEAVRRARDVPSLVARRALTRAIYPAHPLGSLPDQESLQKVGRDDLVAFHQRFAVPSNVWLAMTGDFRTDQLLGRLRERLGDWQNADRSPQAVPPLAVAPSPTLQLDRRDIPQTTILFGELGVAKDNPDLPALRVMNYILGGGGFNSRLMREIRSNRGLAYSVYSYYQTGRRLPGLFMAGVETRNDAVPEVVALMRGIMEQMRDEPVSAAELELAKESLVNSFVFAFEDNHDVVTQSLRLDLFDYPPDYLETYRERIAAVTVEDVRRVADRYLRPDRQVVVLVGAPPAPEDLAASLGLPLERLEEAP